VDSVTLILPTLDDCLRLARACGYRAGVHEPFDAAGERVWVDLSRPGVRYGSFATGPEWVRTGPDRGYVDPARHTLRLVLVTHDGRRVEGLDPVRKAVELRLTFQTAAVRAREGVER
jgi:hypothetical protein